MKKVQSVQGEDPLKNMFNAQGGADAGGLPPGMAELFKNLSGDMGSAPAQNTGSSTASASEKPKFNNPFEGV